MKTKKSVEDIAEETKEKITLAIHRQKVVNARRKALCQKDDCEIVDEQVFPTSFKGTHPIGEDANTKSRRQWLKDKQCSDSWNRFCRGLIMFTIVLITSQLTVALLKFIFKK